MSVVPPLGNTRWTRYAADTFAVGEQLALHVGRFHSPQDRLPIVFFHDYQHEPVGDLVGAFNGVFSASTITGYPLIAPDLGGTSQWATPDVVDTGGHVDDALAWAENEVWIGTRTDKVAILAFGMGTLNALNWAWRHPGQVRSMVLVGPIVDAEKFYDDNPGLQAAINADWGSGAAFAAALPDIDPMRNLDLVRPFAHRIQLWYGDADTQIDGADVRAFAELTGAEAVEFEGTEAQRHLVPADRVASFTTGTVRNRARAYVGWNDSDLGRFEELLFTWSATPANRNVHELRTGLWVGGRRAEFHRVSGSDGDERWGYMLTELQAPDTAVSTTWFQQNGGLMAGQHGNFHRANVDRDAGTYSVFMTWSDIFGVTPWKVNMAVWDGVIGGTLNLRDLVNTDIAGLRLSAGGEVLASERIGGQVTLVVHAADLDRAFTSRTLDVDIDGPLGDHLIIGAVRSGPNTITYAQAGADIPNGGAGSWADFGSCYPYRADTDLIGDTMRGRFYPIGMDPPAMDDPDWSMSWTNSGGWGTDGYGPSGLLFAHVGIFADPSDLPTQIQAGRLTVDER